MKPRHATFCRLAETASNWAGKPAAFALAVGAILLWLLLGPVFSFSENWQLMVNTGTTIVTFLLVFVIQNSQNRETRALHLKIDELIRATHGAHTGMIEIERLTDEEIAALCEKYQTLAERYRRLMLESGKDTDVPEIDLIAHRR